MAQLRIFVSHSSHDNEWCRPFADALKAVGYDVWYDETGLQGGAAWVDSIQREVENRDVFLLVLTPEAWESKWVQDELQLAIATRKRILPVLLRNTQVSGFLLTTQWITVIGEEPQAAARAAIMAIEAPPAPGRDAAPQATTETLDDLITLCKSLSTEGRYTEALSTCSRALSLDPKNLDVLTIKASILHQIGESHLEGQTWFQVILIDPSNGKFWDSMNNPYISFWNGLNDERDLLQAYSVLHSVNGAFVPRTRYLERGLLTGLRRINRLDAAVEAFRSIEDNSLRMDIWGWLQGGYGWPEDDQRGYPILVQLMEAWYGYPPRLNAIADMPTLDMYAQGLTAAGRRDDARSIRNLAVNIFESAYGGALKWKFRSSYDYPWRSDGERTAYRIYLKTLDELGRTGDANRLRKAYPSLST